MKNQLRALQITVPSGEPSGPRIVESSGWDGMCYIVPRQSLNMLSDDFSLNSPGLYFLFGKDESSNDQLAYIGESENFFNRITSHNAKKEFWDEAIIFTGKLNKAHVKYLEYKSIQLAQQVDRIKLENTAKPIENTLSAYDRISAEVFFHNVQFILNTFGYEIFKTLDESVASTELYYLKGTGFDATAKPLDNGGMIVLAGSYASIPESNSFGGWAKAARKQYLEEGILVENSGMYRFTQNVTFRKPSAAAATVAARSINGWTAWKDKNKNSLDDNVRKH